MFGSVVMLGGGVISRRIVCSTCSQFIHLRSCHSNCLLQTRLIITSPLLGYCRLCLTVVGCIMLLKAIASTNINCVPYLLSNWLITADRTRTLGHPVSGSLLFKGDVKGFLFHTKSTCCIVIVVFVDVVS